MTTVRYQNGFRVSAQHRDEVSALKLWDRIHPRVMVLSRRWITRNRDSRSLRRGRYHNQRLRNIL